MILSMQQSGLHPLRQPLDALYQEWNDPAFIPPDPLMFVVKYNDSLSREIVGMLAASLAFGNVKHIARGMDDLLHHIRDPREFTMEASRHSRERALNSFRYRFVKGADVAHLITGMHGCISRYGSLGDCFLSCLRPDEENVMGALDRFTRLLRADMDGVQNYLLPDPANGAACKRLHLFLRWMIRRDQVDPGPWSDRISPALLCVPLDTHMSRIARLLGLTRLRHTGRSCVLDVTRAFSLITPEDPVKYDFALTRLGMSGQTEALASLAQVAGASRQDR